MLQTTPGEVAVVVPGGEDRVIPHDNAVQFFSWGSTTNTQMSEKTEEAGKFVPRLCETTQQWLTSIETLRGDESSLEGDESHQAIEIREMCDVQVTNSYNRTLICKGGRLLDADNEKELNTRGVAILKVVMTLDSVVAVTDKGEVYMGEQQSMDATGLNKLKTLSDIKITDIEAGPSHILALAGDHGVVYSWGSGDRGKLGHGDLTDEAQPKRIDALRSHSVREIACGRVHSVARTDDGRIFTWGCGDEGQLGASDTKRSAVPLPVLSFGPPTVGCGCVPASKVACGGWHCLVIAGGELFSWGYGNIGQLGVGSNEIKRLPTIVGGPLQGKTVTDVAAGAFHSVALTEDNLVYTWGSSFNGQLGRGFSKEASTVPNIVQLPLRDFKPSRIFCGDFSSFVLSKPIAKSSSSVQPSLTKAAITCERKRSISDPSGKEKHRSVLRNITNAPQGHRNKPASTTITTSGPAKKCGRFTVWEDTSPQLRAKSKPAQPRPKRSDARSATLLDALDSEQAKTKVEQDKRQSLEHKVAIYEGVDGVLAKMSLDQVCKVEATLLNTLKKLSQRKMKAFETSLSAAKRDRNELEELRACKVCQTQPRCVTLLPCRHHSLCEGCSASIDICPMCRSKIETRITTFGA